MNEPRNTIYLQLEAELLFDLHDRAKALGVTLNALINQILSREMGDKIDRVAAGDDANAHVHPGAERKEVT